MLSLLDSPDSRGFEQLAVYDLGHSDDAFNESFFHASAGYVGVWQDLPAEITLPAGAAPEARYVALRVAQVVAEPNDPGRSMTLEVELEDAAGNVVTAPSDWAGSVIPGWYERPPWPDPGNDCQETPIEKTVLSTVHIPVACFQGDGAFSFANLESVRVRPQKSPGALALTDFQVVSR